MKLADTFHSRRQGRRWVAKAWPDFVFIRLNTNTPVDPEGFEWAKNDPDIIYDDTGRRWWFKSRTTAIEFKLKFVGRK